MKMSQRQAILYLTACMRDLACILDTTNQPVLEARLKVIHADCNRIFGELADDKN